MSNIHSTPLPMPHVTAMFQDGISMFPLSRDMTYGDLAGRLGRLSSRHSSKAIGFVVKFD